MWMVRRDASLMIIPPRHCLRAAFETQCLLVLLPGPADLEDISDLQGYIERTHTVLIFSVLYPRLEPRHDAVGTEEPVLPTRRFVDVWIRFDCAIITCTIVDR